MVNTERIIYNINWNLQRGMVRYNVTINYYYNTRYHYYVDETISTRALRIEIWTFRNRRASVMHAEKFEYKLG